MTGALELSAILVELLGYGLIIYMAFSVDRVLCHSRHLEEKPGLRFLCYVLSGGISFVFLRMVQNLKVGGWTRAALLLGLCLAARLVIYYVSEVIPERYQRQWMAESEKLLEENYQRLAAQQDAQARQLHDLKNHLNVLASLTEDVPEARKYIQELQEELLAQDPVLKSGNRIIDAIAAGKAAKARELGIAFTVHAQLSQEISLSAPEICSVLSNQLDNALEAAALCKENPWISLEIIQRNGFTYCTVKNSAVVNPFDRNGKLISLKKGPGHGLGLRSIRETLSRHGGTLVNDYSNHVFTSIAMF